MTTPLRLIAFDTGDLAVISANLQDALIAVADMTYLPQARRFAAVGKRFDWVKAGSGIIERCATGFHFERVLGVRRTGFDQSEGARVLNLLAVDFEPTDGPAGQVRLTFSGGAAVRLDVECLEAQMRDLGERWQCTQMPAHPVEEALS